MALHPPARQRPAACDVVAKAAGDLFKFYFSGGGADDPPSMYYVLNTAVTCVLARDASEEGQRAFCRTLTI